MEEAVAVARERSTKGDIVSLSPASASFGLTRILKKEVITSSQLSTL